MIKNTIEVIEQGDELSYKEVQLTQPNSYFEIMKGLLFDEVTLLKKDGNRLILNCGINYLCDYSGDITSLFIDKIVKVGDLVYIIYTYSQSKTITHEGFFMTPIYSFIYDENIE